MTIPEQFSGFLKALETEKRILSVFIEVLRKEEQALIDGKADDIDLLTSEKTRLFERLLQLDKKRNSYLESQEFSLKGNTILDWIEENCTKLPMLKESWNELLNLAKMARQLNLTNGSMISNHLQHNQQTLAAIQCATGNISLYGPQGQTYF